MESTRASQPHQLVQPVRFGTSDRPAEGGDAVIPPALIIELRGRPLIDLDDEIVVQHSLDGAVERARAQSDVAVRARQYFLDDPVAMTVLVGDGQDRKSTRLNSSHSQISYAVFCLKKKKISRPFNNSN